MILPAKRTYRAPLLFLAALAACARADGFGVDGHRIAGLVAHQRLCEQAEVYVRLLGQGRGLDELGQWADWIRSEPSWTHTAPWHYMNVADGARLESYRHPPEGDILWAIGHFAQELKDLALPAERRLDALRFLAHFVVDIHQPLHVGRESDRGGNTVLVHSDTGETMNLHRFWDSEPVALAGLSPDAYAGSLSGLVDENAESWERSSPLDWARESQALRPRVYDLHGADSRLQFTREYLDTAERLVRLRLAQAGVRLAAEVNRALCSGR